ncbi:restriction endonuclease subunit S [Leuconostoc citreum]|uniref:restriction endonuclease subunit S n=1 Tax=Leuconostoc citreum TaxID=33964 RepID=UPI0021A7AA06|nr:restriction endonuclease subunit S [Leuconostoc citreum]MCT3073723.1 restriction endonuclease subunit S [Leuconostoc citreum]
MQTKKRKSPSLRFRGYTDDWEERKLGDVGNTFTGLTGKTKEDFGHGSAKFVTYVNVFQNPIATLDQLDAVEIDEKQNQVQKGDVFFTTSSETPEEVGMSSVWTHDTENVYLNSFTFGYRPQVSFDLNYMASMLRSPSIRKKITFLAQGISRYNISKTKMLDIEIPIPNFSEQEKIGSLFKAIDNTIALHQRKLDLLKEQKKGFLQKMFPKNGAKVPELRFAGFTDDWEERKFDECFKFPVSTNSLSRALLNYDEGDIKSVHYGDILIKYPSILNVKNDKIPYITDGKLEKYKSSLLENGDLIFADAAEDETVGKAVEVNDLTEEHLVSGLHTIVARSKDKKAEFFLGYYINSNIYHRQLLKLMQGSKVSSISKGNLQKTLVSFPKDFEEQQKIGSFFKQLDSTIALHQRKLDLLKEQKKGYLQKMFV